jgi:hypothetical protein
MFSSLLRICPHNEIVYVVSVYSKISLCLANEIAVKESDTKYKLHWVRNT